MLSPGRPLGAVQPPSQVDESQVGLHRDAGERTVQVGCECKTFIFFVFCLKHILSLKIDARRITRLQKKKRVTKGCRV